MNYNEAHKQRLKQYGKAIDKAYSDLINGVSEIVVKAELTTALFSFASQKKIKKIVDDLLNNYNKTLLSIITNGISKEWEFGNLKNDDLEKSIIDSLIGKVPDQKLNELKSLRSPRNEEALKTFQERKRGKFTISERVWNLTNNQRIELEFATDLALAQGKSANELAREIKKYLNEPDKLFRRVRDKHGNLVMSKAMKNYHSGQGVYRSSYKNALRFASNEINIAYKESDMLRMSQNKDVVGYKVFLSPQHKVYDICDELEGKYPKDFSFNGWHVLCKCGVTAILKTESELISEIKKGLELDPNTSKNFVADVPDGFNKWVSQNQEKVSNWKSKPYFWSNNKDYIDKAIKKN